MRRFCFYAAAKLEMGKDTRKGEIPETNVGLACHETSNLSSSEGRSRNDVVVDAREGIHRRQRIEHPPCVLRRSEQVFSGSFARVQTTWWSMVVGLATRSSQQQVAEFEPQLHSS